MPHYIEYTLDSGATLWVQLPEPPPIGMGNASNTGPQKMVATAQKTLREALSTITEVATTLHDQLTPSQADEMEVSFSLSATGELGNFAIGAVKAEAAYSVTLTWKKAPPPAPQAQSA